jgi:hypothetical protein
VARETEGPRDRSPILFGEANQTKMRVADTIPEGGSVSLEDAVESWHTYLNAII